MGCPLVTDAMTEDMSVLFPVEGSPMKALNWLLTSRFVARNWGALATTSSALMTSATIVDSTAHGLVLAVLLIASSVFCSNASIAALLYVDMRCPFLRVFL